MPRKRVFGPVQLVSPYKSVWPGPVARPLLSIGRGGLRLCAVACFAVVSADMCGCTWSLPRVSLSRVACVCLCLASALCLSVPMLLGVSLVPLCISIFVQLPSGWTPCPPASLVPCPTWTSYHPLASAWACRRGRQTPPPSGATAGPTFSRVTPITLSTAPASPCNGPSPSFAIEWRNFSSVSLCKSISLYLYQLSRATRPCVNRAHTSRRASLARPRCAVLPGPRLRWLRPVLRTVCGLGVFRLASLCVALPCFVPCMCDCT
jgi:hypothetical protein